MEPVAVVGATGYTGRLVVGALLARGASVVAAGRNPGKLAALPAGVDCRVVDAADGEALAGALAGCRAVVSCVGSFAAVGEPVVAAAIAAGAHYVDTTGELSFMRRIFTAYDGRARQAGVAVVPAVGFHSSLADAGAALAAGALGRTPDTVDVVYRLSGARPSRGTLRTNLRRASLPCHIWVDGNLVARRIGDDPRPYPFPDGTATIARWPLVEVLTVPRHTGARSVAVYMAMPRVVAALLRNPRAVSVLQPVGRALAGRGTGGPTEAKRRSARYVVIAEAVAAGAATRCVIEGTDLYGVTAAACADAVERLSAPGFSRAGALAPAEVFDPGGFLDGLAGHLSWRIER